MALTRVATETPDARGVLHSRVFPGLCLPLASLVQQDLATVLAEQRAAQDTPAHQTFVASLPPGAASTAWRDAWNRTTPRVWRSRCRSMTSIRT